ncbi:MAG TPA: hypothetical protein DEF47_08680 [Herpetosiphon sp.]|uniref:Thioester reductase domain n=1 Tax=Herpetosiphon aurantiacus (strain ATCC 23779 / DSM 785 / 114-95) TaxID=316274 RepID=A9AW94_HERA2|nr:thioester reductase domain-containing protein [Herpetosiphon sp.]ABX04744.1 thioester reductase domain [Herpetosiphon aurantiacus DSM 785]HBW49968.1 hypothetical protein [Herpetosiphon sp.]
MNLINKVNSAAALPLREYLQHHLPESMLPTAFVELRQIPRLPNGKVDRAALPTIDFQQYSDPEHYVAPRTTTEQQLAYIWQQTLRVPQVGIHDNFFALGGDSITSIQVAARANQAGIRLTARQLFEQPTIAQLAHGVAITDQRNLLDEIVLDPAINPLGLAPYHEHMPQSILLTGATGFLGPYLLAELLTQTSAHIYCVVRAADETQAFAKIRQQLEHANRWEPAFASRLIVMLGDLSLPQLGMTAADWQMLAQTIDRIYHNGAVVNLAHSYAQLKASNVQATIDLLRLASQVKLKSMHFSSTTSVFPANTAATVRYEQELPSTPDGLITGYAQTKWVAEHLLLQARARGIPINCYRPGRIGWDTQTGQWNRGDGLYRLLQGCLQLGRAPLVDRLAEITPVAYVAQAMVALSLQPSGQGQTYHLVNQQHIAWNQLINWMQELGYPIEQVDLDQWMLQLQRQTKDVPNTSLQSLLTLAQAAVNGPHAEQAYDQTAMQAALAATEVMLPTLDRTSLQQWLAQLRF